MKLIYKSVLLLTTALLLTATAQAQLLTRENVQSQIVAGTRPVAGDFGYSLGASFVEIKEMINDKINVRGLPLMNFRYYLFDDLELRLGAQIYSKSRKYEGELENQIGREDFTDKESYMRLMPSVNYHFASNNWLDTYVGAGIIVGKEKDEIVTNDKTNLTGDFYAKSMSKSTLDLGYNLMFGVQMFIADLPLALGVETSIRGLRKGKVEYQTDVQSSVGGVTTNQTYYQLDETSTVQYKSLKYSKSEVGADVRVALTYFFRN
ncbi:hypothetical protein [Marinoscillum sp. MHG1-6]|uniref:hypothetical protein n=1 Tax=Marinoscillum sp. MHG1-6 TaxID=2959627 RepID=UPI0021573546|nr:hypothetical protein [Marinoscillum sp. MHG1-6]